MVMMMVSLIVMAMLLALALLILAYVPAVASAVGYACFVLLLLASLETRTLKLNSKAEGLKPERKLWSLNQNLHPKTKPSNPKSYTARLQPGNAGHGDHANCTRQLPYPHRGPFLGFRARGSQFANGFVVVWLYSEPQKVGTSI